MSNVTYEHEITAFLVIDSHNDFISEGGKAWDRRPQQPQISPKPGCGKCGMVRAHRPGRSQTQNEQHRGDRPGWSNAPRTQPLETPGSREMYTGAWGENHRAGSALF